MGELCHDHAETETLRKMKEDSVAENGNLPELRLQHLNTCRKRADASHGKNSSFKSQVINCFNVFVTIITSKIMAFNVCSVV